MEEDNGIAPQVCVDHTLHLFSEGGRNETEKLASEAAVQGRGARSIYCWMSTWQKDSYCLVATGAPAQAAAFNLVSYYNGGQFIGVMGFGCDFYPKTGSLPVNDGSWHLVGAEYDGLGSLTIFVDGKEAGIKDGLMFNTHGANNLLGQSNHSGYENPFVGAMHGLCIYDRPLSTNERLAFLEQRPASVPPPRPEPVPLFQEKWRPQFHFTAEKNWLNDPNGMVYFEGEYHLFFQHNPHGNNHANMTWGHAVSEDLLHWKQLEHALWPDSHGAIWSGCAVVDWQNTAGFKRNDDDEPCLVAHYTSAGKQFTQSLAHSCDRGRTWTKIPAVVPHIRGGNRDPKILWHAPSKKWIMALYLDASDFALLGSYDLKQWNILSQLRLPGDTECPDFFELPVDGAAEQTRWVFWGASGLYFLGSFDGTTFVPDTAIPLRAEWGSNGYAAQTFSDAPEMRRIQISWMRGGRYPGMPFNQQMSFPVELSLRSVPGSGVRLCRAPVRELEALHGSCEKLHGFEVPAGKKKTFSTKSRLMDIRLKLPPSSLVVSALRLSIFGQELEILGPSPGAFDNSLPGNVKGSLRFGKRKEAPLCCVGEVAVDLQVLVDAASVEIFDLCGEAALHECFLPDHSKPSLELFAPCAAVAVDACIVHELRSTWRSSHARQP